MRYLDVRLRQPDWMLHPMQEFIRNEDVVRYEELLAWNLLADEGIEYELFYVEADREPYEDAVRAVSSIRDYEIEPIDDASFHVYACQETREDDVRWREAFAALNLVVVPPVVFDRDAAMHFTLVGAGEDLRTMLENVPDEIDVEVTEIGSYGRRSGLSGRLTERQREAIEIAFELGYYEVPRESSLAAVARALGCSESSASVLVRRAEAAVMERVVEPTIASDE